MLSQIRTLKRIYGKDCLAKARAKPELTNYVVHLKIKRVGILGATFDQKCHVGVLGRIYHSQCIEGIQLTTWMQCMN